MKIVVAGGTGFIGRELLQALAKDHTVVCLTRKTPGSPFDRVEYLLWDGCTVGSWAPALEGVDAVINLAGESIGAKRWTTRQKKSIVDSRVNATRSIVQAMSGAMKKPAVLINGSAVGYYGNVPDGDVFESHPPGSGFLAETCVQWEEEAKKASTLGIRVVCIRTGVVLGHGSEALSRITLPYKLFVGGPVGSGRQWFPWIHKKDIVGLICFALQTQSVSGALNAVAPDVVTMKEFSKGLGKAMRRPSLFPVPALVLKLALGEMSDMVLSGQKVVPTVATKAGYVFKFSSLESALADLFRGMKALSHD
ncbi:MAG TPA: TIGR01777 family oxidoreductase [Bacteroidota bacterium]